MTSLPTTASFIPTTIQLKADKGTNIITNVNANAIDSKVDANPMKSAFITKNQLHERRPFSLHLTSSSPTAPVDGKDDQNHHVEHIPSNVDEDFNVNEANQNEQQQQQPYHEQKLLYQNNKYFAEYEKAMNDVLSSFRIMQNKDKVQDFEVAKQYLFSQTRYAPLYDHESHSEKESDDNRDDDYGMDMSVENNDKNDTSSSQRTFIQRIESQKTIFIQSNPQNEENISSNNSNNNHTDNPDNNTTIATTTTETETSTNPKTITNVQNEMILRSLGYMGDYCAKHQIYKPLFVAWEKIVECGFKPRINNLSSYLYMLSAAASATTSTTDDNNGDDMDNNTLKKDSAEIVNQVAHYHDMFYSPTESTVSIRIKSLIEMGKSKEAEKLLWNLQSSVEVEDQKQKELSMKDETLGNKVKKKKNNSPKNIQLRLRTCYPILEYYCRHNHDGTNSKEGISNSNIDDGSSSMNQIQQQQTIANDISCALSLYHKMKSIPTIHFDNESYTMLLSSIARNGYFCGDESSSSIQQPVQSAIELGHSPGYGPLLFDKLAEEMSSDILELCDNCVNQIRNAFVVGFEKGRLGVDSNAIRATQNMAQNLYYVPYDCHLSPVQTPANDDELVVNRVTIDEKTNVCPRTNAKLRLILLDSGERKHMHDTLLNMADLQYEVYDAKLQAKGQKSSDPSKKNEENYARNHLDSFATWLDTREGKPFTAIVDGANVAYFGLGSINYHQVKLMVDALEEMGETPLVVIPQKYAQNKFYLRKGYIQELTPPQLQILDDLNESGKLYQVPQRCLDDYYWMLSSVSNQTTSRASSDINVSPSEVGRWPGTRPILITNDQMRDHKLELLEPRLFRRWFGSHIVNYKLDPFVKGIDEERDITFLKADSFSREIQGNYPLSSSNEENGEDRNAMSWHFPVKGWDHNDRFCVRIPKS